MQKEEFADLRRRTLGDVKEGNGQAHDPCLLFQYSRSRKERKAQRPSAGIK
jgi:hypothetical protein